MIVELIINRIHAVDGSMIISPGRGKVASVSGASGSETIYIENPEGSALHSFAVNDLIITQRVDVDSTTVVKKVVRRVTSINTSGAPPNVLLYYVLTNDAGALPTTGAIAAGDTFVVIGNTTVAARQNSIYMSATDSDNPFIQMMADVDSWADWTNVSKIRGLFGNLANKYGYGAGDIYGFAAGKPTGPNVTVDPTNGIRFRATTTTLAQLTGTTFTIKSANTGQRIEISGPDGDLKFYNSTPTLMVQIGDGLPGGGNAQFGSGDSRVNIGGGYASFVSASTYSYALRAELARTGSFNPTGHYFCLQGYYHYTGASDDGVGMRIGVDGTSIASSATSIAVGIHGSASGGVENWAGYFDAGDVYIGNNLAIDGNFSNVLKAPDGAEGAPAFTFASDPDTGIYQAANNKLSLVAGGGSVITAAGAGLYLDALPTTASASNLYCAGAESLLKRSTAGKLADKENIRSIEIDTSKIYDLNPISFASKLDLDKDDRPIDGFFGLIAEEVHETLPNLCGYNEKGEPDWVQYQMLPVLMLPEMKKLRSRISGLEREVATLKTQLAIA